MPIQVQCCGLVVMMVLFYFYKSQRTITLNTVKAFRNSFVTTFINIVLDIASCIVIRFRESIPGLLVDAVCKSYLASLSVLAYFALLYIMTDVYLKKSDFYKISVSYGIFMGIDIILIYILPINYYDDVQNKVLYSYGPSDYATYAFALFTIIFILFALVRQKNKISKNGRFAALTWVSVWLVAAVVQFIRPELLLVGFANSIDMLVLYLILENPVNNIDKRTGLFNHGAFLQYTKQLYESENKFSALVMVLEHSSFKAMNAELEEEILSEAAAYLISKPNLYAFNNTGSEIVLVMPEGEEGKDIMKSVRERFEQGWGKNGGIFISPYWIFVPDSSLASDPENLLHLIRYAKQNCDEKLYENRYVEVNDEIAERLRNKREIEQLILDALDNDRLEVWYQPIYSTKLNSFTAAEALV